MKNVVGVLLVLVVGYAGITFARQAFSNGVQTVIASEPAPTKVDTGPITTWNSDCILGPMNDRPVNQNRCHAEAIWAKQDAAPSPANHGKALDVGMTKSESAVLWFSGSMIALLLVLGAAGAGVMWMVKE